MAFRMSDRDKAAIQAAAAIRQSNQAQADYDALMPQAMAKINQAQQGPSNPLESILSGIGNSIANVGKTLVDIPGTMIANYIDLAQGKKQDSEGSNTQEWKKSLYGGENAKDRYAKTAGTALDAAATVSDLIPGLGTGAKVALNVGQGVASGIANPFIEKGSQATLEDAVKGALVGGASAGVGQYVGGKLANRAAGNGLVSKALNSNVGKGAITGGLAGAAGGGLYAGLNNGDVLQGALQGAQGGAMAGGTMAGAMGLLGSGIDKLNNKYNKAQPQVQPQDALQAPQKPVIDEVAEQYTKKPQTIETALQEAQAPTRRTIDVQYDDGSNGNVALRRNRSMYSLPDHAGSTLDGIIGPNNARQLPNAQKPTYKMSAYDAFNAKGDIEPIDIIRNLDEAGGLSEATMNMLKDEIDDYRYTRANAALQAYGLDNKSELPKLNREQYYKDNMGQLAANGGNGAIRAEDVEDYMYNHLSDEVGKNSLGRQVGDNATILRELIGDRADNMSIDEMYDIYRMLAKSDSMANADMYSRDNILNALAGSPELNRRLSQEMYDYSYPGTGIGVKGQTSLAERVDVNTPDRGRLVQDVTPQRRQAQPQVQPQVQAQPIQETPTQSVAPRVRRATDMSNIQEAPNLDPADVARLEREITVNRQKQGAALLEQYGELDKPTRRAVGSAEDVLATLYNDYGLKTPDDVQYAANHVTGKNGLVSKMTRELASNVGSVDTTITKDWLDGIIEDNGLTDTQAKTVTNQIKGALKRASVNSDGNTALDVMKQLERNSARYKGKDGTYHNSTPDDKAMGGVIDLVHDELQDRLWDAAGDPKKVLTQERLIELKNMYKGNNAWADFVDNRLAKARDGAELRATMKPLVDGSKIVDGAKMSAGGFGNNMRRLITGGHPLQAFGQMAYDLAAGSEPAKQARAAKYAGNANNAQAQLEGKAPVQQAKTGLVGKAKNIGQKAVNKAGKAAEMLNNDTFSSREISPITRKGQTQTIGDVAMRRLSRQAGLDAMQQQDRQNAIQNATQEAQDVQSNYENSMLQAQQTYNQSQQALSSGSSSLDRIGAAMERALTAGDINAYSQLASLYQEAAKIYQLQNPSTTSEAKALSANQSKAMTGLQQLQGLQAMQPGVRTALANTPLSGIVDLTGGDSYANQAKSLALTLGYLQSGANITPREAENIGRAYIPSAFDSEQERQNKLSRAEQLLRNYLADTSSLESIQ